MLWASVGIVGCVFATPYAHGPNAALLALFFAPYSIFGGLLLSFAMVRASSDAPAKVQMGVPAFVLVSLAVAALVAGSAFRAG
jgi:hypothetical protein